MQKWVVYDSAGRIKRYGTITTADPKHVAAQAIFAGEAAMTVPLDADVGDVTHYVKDGAVVERPACSAVLDKMTIAADGIDHATISGLPNPSKITIAGPHGTSSYTETDGSFELSTTWPGSYTVKVDTFPMRDWSATINAS